MKTDSTTLSRNIFRLVLAVLAAITLGALAWVYLEFGDALVGKIAVTDEAQILSTLDLPNLEKLDARMQERLKKPYLTAIRNPFVAASAQVPTPAPAPTPARVL